MLSFFFKKINFLSNVLICIKNLFIISTKDIKIAFYSESRNYQKFALPIIKIILKSSSNSICYISSDKTDRIENSKVENFYIGDGIIRNIFFLIIKTNNFFLTLTDLDNHFLKKTKNVKKYIYYFHSPMSTFKIYTSSAFDNYDIILCNGKYQKKEIEFRETFTKKKKNLVEYGYPYFDYLKKALNDKDSEISNEILVAPSWNLNEKNFISEKIIHLIDRLVELNTYKIRFRPHPEHFKRSKHLLDMIKNKFSEKNFVFDGEPQPFDSLRKAKYLITDTSGIALEYLLIFRKPVIYYKVKDKIHNKKIDFFGEFTAIEDIIKSKFGLTLDIDNLGNIDEKIKNFNKKFKNIEGEISSFLSDNFYNIDGNEEVLKKKINQFIDI
tara:strand:+ start:94 stop:1242 length:1149 start_codon:yes stop_codon:yes gene_type:complete